jgi:hypothetical protein
MSLVKRFPGLYVPPLPKKKLSGSLTKDIAEERCFVLNRFVKQLVICPYLYDSDEFQIFLKPECQSIDQTINELKIDSNTATQLEALDPYFYV